MTGSEHSARVAESQRSEVPEDLPRTPTGYLLVVSGAAHGRLFRLDSRLTVLGSATEVDVLLADDGVTKHHAQLRRESPHQLVLESLDARGTTFVNGIPVERRALVPGDRIQLGEHTRLKYLSRLGDGLELRTSPSGDSMSNGVPTRSGIKVRPASED